ncbi:cupin domain-containing protein [Altererythrobacter sp. MF3-039]|uniref:cupin domain-containing protein n=1 Tax=Altererythrobacter sp. MF3-039 TaxID=3252901 RepID=UPI00390C5BC5
MLDRGHIEFIQAQMLPWQRIGHGLARPDAEYKMLSRDPQTGACSVLMRYPAGWSRKGPEHILAAEEFFILEGSLFMDGHYYGENAYAYLPAGWSRSEMHSDQGCVLLAFYDAEPTLVPEAGDGSAEQSDVAIPVLDTAAMTWDLTLNDENLRHLGIGRKNLRTDPHTGERSFLSLILPQAEPPGHKGPQEFHPVVEEAYLIGGSLTGPHGTMHPGAYFWRPPAIPHGPFGARWGAVSLIRFVGGRHVNEWSETNAPFSFDAPYDPILPDEFAYLATRPWIPSPPY